VPGTTKDLEEVGDLRIHENTCSRPQNKSPKVADLRACSLDR